VKLYSALAKCFVRVPRRVVVGGVYGWVCGGTCAWGGVYLCFLSSVSKTQPNHWTKRVASTRLATSDPRTFIGQKKVRPLSLFVRKVCANALDVMKILYHGHTKN